MTKDLKELNECWYIYIIETNDKKLYVGITKDVEKRVELHVTKSSARRREIELKGFSRQKKFAVIRRGSSGFQPSESTLSLALSVGPIVPRIREASAGSRLQ